MRLPFFDSLGTDLVLVVFVATLFACKSLSSALKRTAGVYIYTYI